MHTVLEGSRAHLRRRRSLGSQRTGYRTLRDRVRVRPSSLLRTSRTRHHGCGVRV